MSIELDDTERRTLQDVLQKHLSELSWEIAFTHNKEFSDALQKRKESVEGFIRRLGV